MLGGATQGDVFDAVVALCAFGALALSIWQEYARRQASKPNVRVTMKTGFTAWDHGELSEGELMVEAVNAGEKPVTLNLHAMLELPDGRQLLLPPGNTNVTFPHQLDPGKSCMTWMGLANLAATLRREGFTGKCKLVGRYRDQLDNTFRSKPFEFDPSGWPDKRASSRLAE